MQENQSVRFGPYHFERHTAQLRRGKRVVPLTRKAGAVLQCLIAQPEQLVTKDALFQAVWPEMLVSEGVLTNCIAELRQALGDDARRPRFIVTVHRQGYRFIAPLSTPAPAPGDASQALDPALAPEPRQQTAPLPVPQPALPSLLGRNTELDHLHHLYTQALHGQRQVVFVTGEAGIGKTALVETFVHGLQHDAGLWIGHGQCIEQYGAGEAYLPLLEALDRLCRGPTGERLVALLTRYAPSWIVQLPALLGASALADLQHALAGTTRARMLRELSVAFDVVSATQPLVLVLEDLQWSDPSTIECLAMLARRRESARLLVLGTYRPVDLIVYNHPLHAVKQELAAHQHCVDIPLSALSRPAVAAYVAQRGVAPEVSTSATAYVYQRTGGHPLFMVQMVDYLEHQDLLRTFAQAAPGGVTERTLDEAVPQGLRHLLEAQMERLATEEQQVLEVGSVAGAEFLVASVAAGLQTLPDAIEEVCERLARREQFLDYRGLTEGADGTVSGRYGFRHALYQQVLYQRLSATRRMRLHLLIGNREETLYGARASEQAAELAMHFEYGRDYRRAVQYLGQAADNAAWRHAPHEIITLRTRALELLSTFPGTPARTQQELGLQLALGAAFQATRGLGAPEVEQAYARARALCAQLGDTPELFSTLLGLWRFYLNRGTLATARALAAQLDRLAQRSATPAQRLVACHTLGDTLFYLGDYTAARTHLERGIAMIDPTAERELALHYGMTPGVMCLIVAAWTLWCLGYPAQAVQRSQEALALAQTLGHLPSLAMAQHYAAFLHRHRRDAPAVQTQAEALRSLATAQELPLWAGLGTGWCGWVLVMQGKGAAGLAQMQQGLADVLATGQTAARPRWLVLLAEAAGYAGQVEVGQRWLAEALQAFEAHGHGDMVAEAYRFQGELLLQQAIPEVARAEACFQQALTIARHQQARSWELRAATSLARLWQHQGKCAAAYELLAPVYNWFSEGFDTADLQDAEALLDLLEEKASDPVQTYCTRA